MIPESLCLNHFNNFMQNMILIPKNKKEEGGGVVACGGEVWGGRKASYKTILILTFICSHGIKRVINVIE